MGLIWDSNVRSNEFILCFLLQILQPQPPSWIIFYSWRWEGLSLYTHRLTLYTFDRGSPGKLNPVSRLWFSFTSTMVHVLGRQARWQSCLVYSGLPCSFSATLVIGCALFPRPPHVPTDYLEGVSGCLEGSQHAATDVDHHPAASPPRIL